MSYGDIDMGQHWFRLLPVAWWHKGNKLLPEPILTDHQWGHLAFNWGKFHLHISHYKMFENYLFENAATFPGSQWVNSLRPSDAYMRRWTGSSLVQIMACRLFGAKPLSEPMLEYCNWDLGPNFSEILIGIQPFSFKKLHLKTSSAKLRLFCLGLNELNMFFM